MAQYDISMKFEYKLSDCPIACASTAEGHEEGRLSPWPLPFYLVDVQVSTLFNHSTHDFLFTRSTPAKADTARTNRSMHGENDAKPTEHWASRNGAPGDCSMGECEFGSWCVGD
jgi:hypothetical protein